MKVKHTPKPRNSAKTPLKFKVYNRPIADTLGCVGQCWPTLKIYKIEIDPRQSQKDYMDTLIHESLHELLPRKREAFILKAGTTIANLLWRLGYRRVRQKIPKLQKKY